MMSSEKSKQRGIFRWLNFSLRTLILFVTLMAILSFWFAVTLRKAKERKAAAAALTKLHVLVSYDFQLDKNGMHIPNAKPPVPEWCLNLLGLDYFADVNKIMAIYDPTRNEFSDEDFAQVALLTDLNTIYLHPGKVSTLSDATLANLKSLPKLTTLSLGGKGYTDTGLEHIGQIQSLRNFELKYSNITDAGVAHLANLTQMETLCLESPLITDEALKHLSQMTGLKRLSLDRSQITDAGLIQIAKFKELEVLELEHTEISDAGLRALESLDQLQRLSVSFTYVTKKGTNRIQAALPNCAQVSLRGPRKANTLNEVRAPNLAALKELGLEVEVDELSRVESVSVTGFAVTFGDEQLAKIELPATVHTLKFPFTDITDAGLEHLTKFAQLQHLDLSKTDISDEGLVHLRQLQGLKFLNLRNTFVSEEGVNSLQRALPECQIIN